MMGKFKDHLTGLDSDLDPAELKDFCVNSEPLTEGETAALHLQCLMSDLIALNERIEAVILRVKYYDEGVTLEVIEEIRDSLKRTIRDFQ